MDPRYVSKDDFNRFSDKVDRRFDKIDDKLESIDKTLTKLSAQFDTNATSMAELKTTTSNSVNSLTVISENTKNNTRRLDWIFGIVAAVVAAILLKVFFHIG